MITPFKRSESPYWWIAYREGGKRIRISTEIRHQKLKTPPRDSTVWDIIRTIEDRLARKRFGLSLTITDKSLSEFAAEFLTSMADRQATSVARYQSTMKGFLEWARENQVLTVADVTGGTAAKYIDLLRGRCAGSTMACNLTILRIAWKMAKQRGYCMFDENPWSASVKIKPSERAPFKAAEIQDLLEIKAPDWVPVAVRIGLYTGARIDSVGALTWEDVAWDFDSIMFRKSKTTRYTMPLHSALKAYLWPLKSTGRVLVDAPKSSAHLSGCFIRVVQRECGWHGTYHQFRHTFNSMLASCGVEKRIAMLLSNHSSAAVNDGYVHVEAANLRPHLEKLNFG